MKIQHLSDRFAMAISFLCLVHCLILPAFVILVPSLALSFLSDEMLHKALLIAALPISFIALAFGFKKHGNASVIATIACGLMLLCFAAFAGHDLLGETGEVALTVLGSLLVALGHFRNTRLNTSYAISDTSDDDSLAVELSER